MGQEEGDRLLAEVHAAQQKRLDRAADREKAQRAKARSKAKAVRPVKAVKAVKKVKVRKAANAARPPPELASEELDRNTKELSLLQRRSVPSPLIAAAPRP